MHIKGITFSLPSIWSDSVLSIGIRKVRRSWCYFISLMFVTQACPSAPHFQTGECREWDSDTFHQPPPVFTNDTLMSPGVGAVAQWLSAYLASWGWSHLSFWPPQVSLRLTQTSVCGPTTFSLPQITSCWHTRVLPLRPCLSPHISPAPGSWWHGLSYPTEK